jgi:hypothetical protein
MWCCIRLWKIIWIDHMTVEEVLHSAKEEWNVLRTTKRMVAE